MVECPICCIALIVLLIVPGLPVHAGTFTLQQMLGSPFPYGLGAASHAPRIAWVFNAKGSRKVWIAEGPNFTARQRTHYSGDDGKPIAILRLTADGRTVVYVRGTEVNQAGRVAFPTNDLNPRKQMVCAIDVDGESPHGEDGGAYGCVYREPANGGWRGGAECRDILAAAKYLQNLATVNA